MIRAQGHAQALVAASAQRQPTPHVIVTQENSAHTSLPFGEALGRPRLQSHVAAPPEDAHAQPSAHAAPPHVPPGAANAPSFVHVRP